jgi:L-ribulose-5-phosphate 3-epimerase
MVNRRQFLQSAAMTGAVVAMTAGTLRAEEPPLTMPKGKLKKAIKFGSVGFGSSLEEKFAAIRAAGFEGVEMDSPSGVNREEAAKAAEKAGVTIHGVVDSVHWKERFSDPDEAVRARGLEALKTALADAKFYGGTTALVVPGRVANAETENYEQVWERSHAQIKKAIPVAEENGVKIAIEVVWNNFITKPEELVKYVDEFKSPWVGAYFDVSNMIKFGVAPADWIRALGKRMLKFDFKGYSKEKQWVKIGDGDENWPEVLKALEEIGYRSWATAEVGAGSKEELEDISARMKKSLGI